MNRRSFLAGVTSGTGVALAGAAPSAARAEGPAPLASDRDYWISVLRRIADPVLTNLANGTLKARMPVEQRPGAGRETVTHLEAIGRLVAGIAPWLELGSDGSAEGRLRGRYADLTHRAFANAVDPRSPDFLNFTRGGQPLVDAAFLAQGILRSPTVLLGGLAPATNANLIAALKSTRVITPGANNWLLFSAMVEAALAKLGAEWRRPPVETAVRRHEEWYKGDGVYGDGPTLHVDYYNSFVIHPMLLDALGAVGEESGAWKEMLAREEVRARRYAAILERLISPEGTFPAVGRSIAYRFGALQALGQAALRQMLPEGVSPPQVRGAMTAVIRRQVEMPGTFDSQGWLTIGFAGHQPGVGETYISTGSLYLCAVGLLPLGLPASDEFWEGRPMPWTQAMAWGGREFGIDHAVDELRDP